MANPVQPRTTPSTRKMAVHILQYANREKVAQALTAQGYSVTRMTVNRWARGSEMPEIAARMIGTLFGHEDTAKTPRPMWAEGLVEDVPAIRADVERVVTELVTLKVALEAIQSGLVPPDDDPADDPAPLASGRKRDQ